MSAVPQTIDRHPLRKLSLTERMSLSFELQGDPSRVTYVAVYPSSASLPTKERIIQRATALVEPYPLLKACVVDARSTSPKWDILPASKVGAELMTLVRDVPIQELQVRGIGYPEKSSADISRTLEKIFDRELKDNQSIGVNSNGFLWRVVRFHNETDATPETNTPAYIALTCNHIVSDGRSGQALLGALLSDTALETSGEEKAGGRAVYASDNQLSAKPSIHARTSVV